MTQSKKPLTLNPPTEDAVMAQFEDIAGRMFRQLASKPESQRLSVFRHIVQESLAGRKPTEHSIQDYLGISAENRDEEDPTVRVEVSQIRSRLDKYYRVHGLRASVNISIPKGGYVADFSNRSLNERLSDAEKILLSKAQTACDKQTLPSCCDALECLNELLQRHPTFHEALVMKTDVHLIRAIQGMPSLPELEQAEAAATRSLEIAPDSWEGNVAQGFVHSSRRKWPEARNAFNRARRFMPEHGPVHFHYVAYLVSQGKLQEAIGLNENAATGVQGYYGVPTLPQPVILSDLGFLYLLADDLKKATFTLEAAIQNAPRDFHMLEIHYSLIYEAQGEPEKMAAILEGMALAPERSAITWGAKAMAYGLAGDVNRAQAELDRLISASEQGRYVPAFQFAIAHLGLRNYEAALRALEQMADDCDPLLHWVGYFPFLRHLAHLSAFHRLLETKFGIKWHWQRSE